MLEENYYVDCEEYLKMYIKYMYLVLTITFYRSSYICSPNNWEIVRFQLCSICHLWIRLYLYLIKMVILTSFFFPQESQLWWIQLTVLFYFIFLRKMCIDYILTVTLNDQTIINLIVFLSYRTFKFIFSLHKSNL